MALPHGANLTRAPLLPAFTALRNKVSFSANDTLLNESMALLGIEALGGGRELGCVLRRLQNREPISIAALGGCPGGKMGEIASWVWVARGGR